MCFPFHLQMNIPRLQTLINIHFSLLTPPFLSPSQSLSLSLFACRPINCYSANLHCRGKKVVEGGREGDREPCCCPSLCLLVLSNSWIFPRLVLVTPAWEALTDKEVLRWNVANNVCLIWLPECNDRTVNGGCWVFLGGLNHISCQDVLNLNSRDVHWLRLI